MVSLANNSLMWSTTTGQTSSTGNLPTTLGGENVLSGYSGLTEEEEKALARHGAFPVRFESSDDSKQTEVSNDENSDEHLVTEIEPVVQNVIATVNLQCKLDLPKIQKKARNAEYNPKRFPALVMRIREPRTTALIFGSGKLVVTGARSEKESRLSAKKFSTIIKKLGYSVSPTEFKVQNVVASCDVGFKLALESLHNSEHSDFCTYEPELFPGLIYRMAKPKTTILVFASGKIVLTGAKGKKDVQKAFNNIFPVLTSFKKD